MLLNFARMVDYQTVDYLVEIMMDTMQRCVRAACVSFIAQYDIQLEFCWNFEFYTLQIDGYD